MQNTRYQHQLCDWYLNLNRHLIVLVTASVVRAHAGYEVQHVYKCPVSIRIPSQGEVAEADIVICGDVARGDTCKKCLRDNWSVS